MCPSTLLTLAGAEQASRTGMVIFDGRQLGLTSRYPLSRITSEVDGATRPLSSEVIGPSSEGAGHRNPGDLQHGLPVLKRITYGQDVYAVARNRRK
jgi:hypothetical protein